MSQHRTPALDYIRKLYASQDALLDNIDFTLKGLGIPLHIGAEEGRMLQLFIALHQVKRIVEVGTLAGYSTLWMAAALPEDGHIYTLNKDPEHIIMARHFFEQSEFKPRITMLEGDAHDTLPQLDASGPFDMIFIDADKGSYNDYLDWAEAHVRPGGLVVADNTLLFGAVLEDAPPAGFAPATWESMRVFNQRLADRERYNGIMIPTQEGLSVAIKRF